MSFFRNMEPVRAPHRTPQFWVLVALLSVALPCTPLILRFLGAPLPPPPNGPWIRSIIITLPIMVGLAWLGFRFGRIAWFLIGVGFLAFGLFVRTHQ